MKLNTCSRFNIVRLTKLNLHIVTIITLHTIYLLQHTHYYIMIAYLLHYPFCVNLTLDHYYFIKLSTRSPSLQTSVTSFYLLSFL